VRPPGRPDERSIALPSLVGTIATIPVSDRTIATSYSIQAASTVLRPGTPATIR
jgi:hypothetical protein